MLGLYHPFTPAQLRHIPASTSILMEERKVKTGPFGVSLMRSQVLYQAAQAHHSQLTILKKQS